MSAELLGCDRVRALSRSADLTAVADALRDAGYHLSFDAEHDPRALEAEVRRIAGERLRLLARWEDHRSPLVAALLEDEDRRSLRTILIGILGGVAADSRSAGLIPTPALPENALEELAGSPSVSRVASQLTAWGSAYGEAIAREAAKRQPDALILQNAIDRVYFAHGSRAARKAGEPLRSHLRLLVDLANARTALDCVGDESGRDFDGLFLDGGAVVTRDRYEGMISEATPSRALVRLLRESPDDTLCRALTVRHPWWNAEDAALAALLFHYRQRARAHPLSAETVIFCALRLRAELRDLSRIIWGVQLDVPREQLTAEMVSC